LNPNDALGAIYRAGTLRHLGCVEECVEWTRKARCRRMSDGDYPYKSGLTSRSAFSTNRCLKLRFLQVSKSSRSESSM